MKTAIKCLVVSDGFICLVDRKELEDLGEVEKKDVVMEAGPGGLVIKLKDVCIPIPVDYVDYLVENRNISIYPFGLDYVEEPVITLELSRDAIIEARAVLKLVYRYPYPGTESTG